MRGEKLERQDELTITAIDFSFRGFLTVGTGNHSKNAIRGCILTDAVNEKHCNPFYTALNFIPYNSEIN